MLGFLRDSDECNGLLTAHRLEASFLPMLRVEDELLIPVLQIPGRFGPACRCRVVDWLGCGRSACVCFGVEADCVRLNEQTHSAGWAHVAVA